jgi:hypothetical protein
MSVDRTRDRLEFFKKNVTSRCSTIPGFEELTDLLFVSQSICKNYLYSPADSRTWSHCRSRRMLTSHQLGSIFSGSFVNGSGHVLTISLGTLSEKKNDEVKGLSHQFEFSSKWYGRIWSSI